MTQDQEYCKAVLARWVGGEHHLPDVKEFGPGVVVNFCGDLSTYDFNGLTNLVLLAHETGVRFGVKSSFHGMVKITAHRRVTGPRGELPMSQWHPGLEELRERIEERQASIANGGWKQ